MKNCIGGLLMFFLTSCGNPVGDSIVESPLFENEISSVKDLDLKKGDEVVFWSKVATRKDSTFVSYKFKYSISLKDSIIEFDNVYIAYGDHIINSKTTNDKVTTSFSEKEDSISYVKNWEFEIENKSFIVPQDGKYNFDFKMYCPDTNFFSNRSSASIIIRKK